MAINPDVLRPLAGIATAGMVGLREHISGQCGEGALSGGVSWHGKKWLRVIFLIFRRAHLS